MVDRNPAKQSPFEKKHIEESAKADTTTLLEHLNLPPAFVTFVEKNKRTLWTVLGVVCAVVVAGSLYDSYATSRQNKAATALAKAAQVDSENRMDALAKVAEDFSGTSPALWSRIELARVAQEKGDLSRAIEEYAFVKGKISAKNPLMPLVTTGTALAYEKNNEIDKAIDMYKELATYQGFLPTAHMEMARLYESQGKKEEAVSTYELFLSDMTVKGQVVQQETPTVAFVKARVSRLKE